MMEQEQEQQRNLSPEFLYTCDASPVQFGSLYQIRKYLRSVLGNDRARLRRAFAELDEYGKTIAFGTHAGRRKRKKGEYHYNVFPHKNVFFETDLMDVFGRRGKRDAALKRLNDNYVYLLFVLNGGTKYLYFRKLKTKLGAEVAQQLTDIFAREVRVRLHAGYRYTLLHSDRGKSITMQLLIVL